jgi:hypothetical protein
MEIYNVPPPGHRTNFTNVKFLKTARFSILSYTEAFRRSRPHTGQSPGRIKKH